MEWNEKIESAVSELVHGRQKLQLGRKLAGRKGEIEKQKEKKNQSRKYKKGEMKLTEYRNLPPNKQRNEEKKTKNSKFE